MIILFVPYRQQKTISKIRDIEECLFKNLANEWIDKIVLVTNEDVSISFDKCEVRKIDVEPTKEVLIDIANECDEMCIIAPENVHADDSIKNLYKIDWSKSIALELCSYSKVNGEWYLGTCQDVVIFKGKLNRDDWFFNPSVDIKFYNVGDPKPSEQTITPHRLDIIKTKPLPKIFHICMYPYLKDPKFINYKFLEWTRYCNNWVMSESARKDFQNRCIEWAKWADIVFVQTQTEGIFTMNEINKMREANGRVKIYFWTGDVREEIPSYFTDIASEVVSLFSNDVDTKTMRDRGFKSEYLNIGYPHDIFHPKGYKTIAEPIVFMGGSYPDKGNKPHFPLSHARRDMVFYLKETYGDRFGVYGNGWSGIETDNISDQNKEASIYRGAKIAINYSHFNYSRYSSDRILRIMGSGCFCLSHKYPDIEKDFEIGKHLDVFESLTELKDKIDYYLEHEEERKRIAEEGAKYVLKNCTWEKRIETLLKMKI